jgi:hypothetical protein
VSGLSSKTGFLSGLRGCIANLQSLDPCAISDYYESVLPQLVQIPV